MKFITAVTVFLSTPRPPTRSVYARMRVGGSLGPAKGPLDLSLNRPSTPRFRLRSSSYGGHGGRWVPGAIVALGVAGPAGAQVVDNTLPTEQVVISASRSGGVRGDLLGSSATVLLPIDFELRQIDIVSDILRDVPGVAVSRTGPVGQLTQVRIRGAEANHTLVLIDGIKASDPFYGEFDFATLIADDVAKVEVLRGEQSALYGSDAIGGVVHYITATGAEAPGFRAHAEGGSFGTAAASARYAGVAGGLDYALSGAYYRTDGVRDNDFGPRKLGSENIAAAGKFA